MSDELRANHTEPPLDRELAGLVSDYREPTNVPRELMWQRIERARGHSRRSRRAFWYLAPAAAAAVLILGIAIGRMGANAPIELTESVEMAPEAPAAAAPQWVAAQYMGRMQTMIAAYRTASDRVEPEVVAWAKDMVLETRLLMHSSVGEDAELRKLLEDLELLLLEIVRASRDDEPLGQQWIERALDDGSILNRMNEYKPAVAMRRA